MRKICPFPKCITILNKYNPTKFCRLHQRILSEKGITYSQGRFYYEADRKKRSIPRSFVGQMKERANIQDILE